MGTQLAGAVGKPERELSPETKFSITSMLGFQPRNREEVETVCWVRCPVCDVLLWQPQEGDGGAR